MALKQSWPFHSVCLASIHQQNVHPLLTHAGTKHVNGGRPCEHMVPLLCFCGLWMLEGSKSGESQSLFLLPAALIFPVSPASSPSPRWTRDGWCLIWQLLVSCIHFGLGSAPGGVCTDTGSPSVVYLNFSFPLKWHHRGSAWLMSPQWRTLFCPKLQQNIWNMVFLCVRARVCQSALLSTFAITLRNLILLDKLEHIVPLRC